MYSMRMRADLREALERAADASTPKHSLADEIESRLERSFTKDDVGLAKFGGARSYAILRTVLQTFGEVGPYAFFHKHRRASQTHEWLDDPYAYDEAVKSAVTLLEQFRPPGAIRRPRPWPSSVNALSPEANALINAALANPGESFAHGALRGILQAETDLPDPAGQGDARHRVAADLGPKLRRRIGPPMVGTRFTPKREKNR